MSAAFALLGSVARLAWHTYALWCYRILLALAGSIAAHQHIIVAWISAVFVGPVVFIGVIVGSSLAFAGLGYAAMWIQDVLTGTSHTSGRL